MIFSPNNDFPLRRLIFNALTHTSPVVILMGGSDFFMGGYASYFAWFAKLEQLAAQSTTESA